MTLDATLKIQPWRQNAPANTNRDTRTKGLRVRELRSACRSIDASTPKETQTSKKTAETKQGQGLAFSLSAPLAFGSLSLRFFPGELIPCEPASSDLTTYEREPLCVREFAPVVAERLLIQIAKQVERFHADVCAMQPAL